MTDTRPLKDLTDEELIDIIAKGDKEREDWYRKATLLGLRLLTEIRDLLKNAKTL